MALFKITANSTVKSFSKAFKDEFGATLQIYNGRLRADENVKLVDIGVKTGTFECRSSRTVGSFIKMMQDDFNMKVKVRTADDWVTVIDGLTLNRINDLPKQTTKTVMEDYVSYQRKDAKPEDEKTEESTSQNELKSEPEEEIKLFEGILPTLSFSKKEKRNALENSKGIVVMARQLMNISDLETLIRYQEEEDMMVLIAINNKTGHVGAIEMSDSVDGILNMFKRKCNIDSLEDYTIYYTSIECVTDDVEEFIESGYIMYLDKNKVGMSDRHCFAESELRKTLNKKFNNAIYADLDIFAGMNKIYSCNMIEVY